MQQILSSNDGMTDEEMGPFRRSIAEAMPEARLIEVAGGDWPPVVARVERWREVLANVPDEDRVMLADGRDQVFQADVFAALPEGWLHVFEEDRSMTIGSCPYNGGWIERRYGLATRMGMARWPILCVGTVVGEAWRVRELVAAMCEEIAGGTVRFPGEEQAVFNVLVRERMRGRYLPMAWENEAGPVYTVGYLPRESVEVSCGWVVNRAGIPVAAVHQWDRHENLKRWVGERWK